ncbi:MAG: hypothetical protein IJX85_02255 [Lachnospiraceae bacterium]|nr:hypothetical protein [Lachnospiraceae bacterium]
MDIMIWILFVIEAFVGVGSIVMIVAVMLATIVKKIYRKVKYAEPIM